MPKKPDEHYWSSADGFREVLKAEHAAIAARIGRGSEEVWTAISLSGGGIRSASFCLGALQALARSEILPRIDYISTVSGGGYLGAGLQWLLCQDPATGAGKKDFPYGVTAQLTIDASKKQTNLQYLRWHANYLLPGNGLDIYSALTVVVRTVFLSLAIWFPLIVLFFFALQLLASSPSVQEFSQEYVRIPLPADLLCPSWTTFQGCHESKNWPDQLDYYSMFYAVSLYVAYAGACLLALLALAVAFVSITRFPQSITGKFALLAVLSGVVGGALLIFDFGLLSFFNETRGEVKVPADAVSFVLAVVFFLVGWVFLLPAINLAGMVVAGERYKNADYFLRRLFERVGGRLLRYTLYALVFGSIPIAYKYILITVPTSSGAISLVSGLATALIGHLGQSKRVNLGPVGQVLAGFVACVFLYSVLIVAYHVSSSLFDPTFAKNHYYSRPIAEAIVIVSMIFGISSNSNTTGLHRFYRDRLMELFMPSAESTGAGISTSSFEADRLSVSQCWSLRFKKPLGLFPIVNCNAILVNDPDPILSSRGGASFAFTPLHIGGESHGWESSASYERKNREISIATAIAASGAAANANSGYVGSGITRNRAVSLVLTLFNIRLGVWIRRPSVSSLVNILKPTPFFPNLWYGPFSQGYRARSKFVEISDGGHFENLGVYELVRRKVDLIIAFDGEADKATALPALVSLARRIEEDFGATLTFESNLDGIMPFTSDKARYPNDAKFAEVPCAKATIRYADEPLRTTTLIYVKASLIDQANFVARGYRAQHPDYPNETTANQFYSPEQFDAYRELGFACTKRTIGLHLVAIKSILERRL